MNKGLISADLTGSDKSIKTKPKPNPGKDKMFKKVLCLKG